MVHKKLNMKANVVNANAEDTIRDIIKIIQQKELVFFVGSAISFADPSKLLSVSQIKENIINKIPTAIRFIHWNFCTGLLSVPRVLIVSIK